MQNSHRSSPEVVPPLVMAALFLCSPFVRAATYHVAPTGNDTGPGSDAQPWATLQHAADSVAAGDEVVVADGDYPGFRLATSGTAAAPIVFRGQGEGTVVGSIAGGCEAIDLGATAHVTITGFRVADAGCRGILHVSEPPAAPSAGVVIRADVVENGGSGGIELWGVTDALVEDNVVRGNLGSAIRVAGGTEVVIQNNVVYGNPATDGIAVGAVGNPDGACSNVVVANNTVQTPDDGGWALAVYYGTADIVAFNNILLSENPATGAVLFQETTGFASARNAVTDRFIPVYGTTPVSLVEFQALGYELGSFVSEAVRLFVDGSMGDFRIRAGCPAVNAGLSELDGHPAPDHDIRGTARPVASSWDLGAYEFCAGWTCDGADGDADADGGADADAPADTTGDGPAGGDDDGGCSCRATSGPVEGGWGIMALLGTAVLTLQRRRKGRREHSRPVLRRGRCVAPLPDRLGTGRGAATLVVVLGVLSASAVRAATYEVGPGMPLAGVGDVPWESLAPGDLVLIHWRAEPYREKFIVAVQATETLPVVVRGVPNDSGALPVIDGQGATTREALDFWNEDRSVIKIGGSNTPACDQPDCVPSWITIENLDVRSARPPYSFTSSRGGGDFADNAAAIHIEVGRNVTIRHCIIRDSGNGLFIGAYEGLTQDILVEGNWIYDNGIEGSYYEHNSYTAARGITFQFNHYGPLRTGCGGNNLKDRSAGLVVRYNWIENGNRQLDLVDGEDTGVIPADPRYRETFVYGNVLVEAEGEGNSQIVHYGGDSGDESIYRKGTLYFYNNTVVSTRSGNTTLFRLSSNDEHCDARNNILYVAADGGSLAMVDETGVLDLSHNWLKPGRVDSHGSLAGTINDDGTSIEGAAPGFINEAGQDFHLAEGAPCINAGTALAAAVLPANDVLMQYVAHQGSEPRPLEPPLDPGAYERCVSGSCGGADADADGDADADADADADTGGDADADSDADAEGDVLDVADTTDDRFEVVDHFCDPTMCDADCRGAGHRRGVCEPGDGGVPTCVCRDDAEGGGCGCALPGAGGPRAALILLLAFGCRWATGRRRRD